MSPGFDRRLLARPTLEAAPALLGARLVRDRAAGRERRVGRIVEVEAYLGPDDQASHARAGMTPRTAVMFGPPGFAYVYLVYGMYDCLNVVTEADGSAGAVLVRAVEPLEGLDAMRSAKADHRRARRRQAIPEGPPRDPPPDRIAAGPGLVAAAFSIDRTMTGLDLCDPASPLRLEAAAPGDRPVTLGSTARIGVGYAGPDWAARPYRFLDRSSRSISTRA